MMSFYILCKFRDEIVVGCKDKLDDSSVHIFSVIVDKF